MLKKLFSSQLRINMMSGTFTTVANLLVAAVSYPLYLHFLGYEMYGVWLILSTVMTFAQLGSLGLGPAVMKFVAEDHARGNLKGIQRYVTTALTMLCFSGIVVLIAVILFKEPIVSVCRLTDQNSHVVAWLLPYVGGLSVYVFVVQTLVAALSGLGRMDLANYIQTIGMIVQVAVAGLLLLAGLGVKGLLFGSIASCFAIHVMTLMFIRRIAPIRFMRPGNVSRSHCIRLVRFGSSVFAGSLVNLLLGPFNKIVLSRYAGVAMVPVYEIAFTGCLRVRGLIEAGVRSITPEISRISAEMTTGAKNRIAHLYRRSLKLVFLFGAPVYAALLLLAPVLLRLWLGGRFVEALPSSFRIMLVGTFVGLVGVPAYYTLLGLGHARHTLGSCLVQGITNVLSIMAVVLISQVSIWSVVWCSSCAMAASTIYLLLLNARVAGEISVSSERSKGSAGIEHNSCFREAIE